MTELPKISCLQYSMTSNVEQNFLALKAMVEAKFRANYKIVLLPELALHPYFPQQETLSAFAAAMAPNHSFILSLQELCRNHQACLCLPIFEKVSSGIYYNSILAIDEKGHIKEKYRKTHIPDDPGFYEKYYFAPGDNGFKMVELLGVKVGLLICWDQWFPEAARLTSMLGADLLYFPTAIAWENQDETKIKHKEVEAWKTVIRSHAICNGLYTFTVNRVGQQGDFSFWGNSFICAPDGEILQQLDSQPGTLDFSGSLDNETQRNTWPFFRDRRIDLYGDLNKRWK